MPRHGIGIDISTLAGSEGVVTTIDDFVFESFSAGEVHPILTTSRTNLLTYSEDFSQSIYSTVRSTLTPNDIVSPSGSTNGFKIEADVTGNSGSWINALVTSYSGGHTISVFAKKGTTEFLLISEVYPNGAVFNLDNGTVKQVSSGSTASISDEGNGWFRCSYSFNTTSATKAFFIVGNSNTSITLHSATDGNNLYLFGAQLEQDILATAYIPTSGSTVTVATTLNDTSEVWDFDSTDIMLEADPEDEGFWEESYPDGASLPELVLNGDYEELGNNILTGNNSTFDTSIGDWVIYNGATLAHDNTLKALEVTLLSSESGAQLPTNTLVSGGQAGKLFKISADIWRGTTTDTTLKIFIGGVQTDVTISDTQTNYVVYLTPSSTAGLYIYRASSGNAGTFYIDNVKVEQVDPNDRWTLTSGWSIEDGKATNSGSGGLLRPTSNSIGTGTTVVFRLTVSDRTTGHLRIQNNGSTIYYVNNINTNNTFEYTFTTIDANGWIIEAVSGFDGKIDNVSVKEYAVQPLDI